MNGPIYLLLTNSHFCSTIYSHMILVHSKHGHIYEHDTSPSTRQSKILIFFRCNQGFSSFGNGGRLTIGQQRRPTNMFLQQEFIKITSHQICLDFDFELNASIKSNYYGNGQWLTHACL